MKKKLISLILTIVTLATVCIPANAAYVQDCGEIMQDTLHLMSTVGSMSESKSLERLKLISDNLDKVLLRIGSENYDAQLTYQMAETIQLNYTINLLSKFERAYGSNSEHVKLLTKIKRNIESIAIKSHTYLVNYPLNFKWTGISKNFSDVPSNAWYYSDVTKTSMANIISGKDETHFDPNGTLTHAEAMTLMAKVHAIHYNQTYELYNNSYSGNHWAGSIREYCKDNKLPYPSDKELDTPISREKMGLYFRKALPDTCYETPGFVNKITNGSKFSEIKSYSHIQDLYKAGIMVGDENGFRLQDSITRAEAAAIIHRVADIYVRVDVASR